jgi:outer membrane lipoprotein-sorting protein
MFIKRIKLKASSIFILLLFYCCTCYASDIDKDLKILEDYLNSINNMSFIFTQIDHSNQKEIGWMQIVKPNKLRIEYKGENDLIILANSYYLVLYKAHDDVITSLSNDGPWNIFTKTNIKITTDINNTEANTFVRNLKKININEKIYATYDILIKNIENKFNAHILLHASFNPFQINGWTLYDQEKEIVKIKIIETLGFNQKKINSNIFSLSEKNRSAGEVWHGPFEKLPIIRKPKHRY